LPEKKHTAEMVGEAFRDIGILVFVFGPLYELFEPLHQKQWSVFTAVIAVGIVFLVCGILIERKRA
jgi:uncharacterized membrane protein (DUF373 family)